MSNKKDDWKTQVLRALQLLADEIDTLNKKVDRLEDLLDDSDDDEEEKDCPEWELRVRW